MSFRRGIKGGNGVVETAMLKNKKGIALLIVLLVTTLLLALVFEFAYATRISLNSAVNFRDSQRAYFLARSGVYAFIKFSNKVEDLKKLIQPGQWSEVPGIGGADTRILLKWSDESGKISIQTVTKDNDAHKRLSQLFSIKTIDQDVLDNKMVEKKYFWLVDELHQVMSDEEYGKIADNVTAAQLSRINANTASLEVLQSLCRSLGKDDAIAGLIVSSRNDRPFEKHSDIVNMSGMDPTLASALSANDEPSNLYTVYVNATVGGYTKAVKTIVDTSAGAIVYWRAL
jgi:type II secretory pathway component PulK